MLRQNPADFVERICRFAEVPLPAGRVPIASRENASGQYMSWIALRFISPLIRSSRGNAFAPSLLGRRVGQAVHFGLQRGLGSLTPAAIDRAAKRRLTAQIEAIALSQYRLSNLQLQELTGLDLAQYGYLLPEQDERFARRGASDFSGFGAVAADHQQSAMMSDRAPGE